MAASEESPRAGADQLGRYRQERRAWRRARVPLVLLVLVFALPIAVLVSWYGAVTTHQILLAPVLFGLVLYAAADTLLHVPEPLASRGRRGRQRVATSRALRALDGRSFTVLHDRAAPWPGAGDGAPDDPVEHLVVGPSGVFAVETMDPPPRDEPLRILGGRLWRGRTNLAPELAAARLRAEALTRRLVRAAPGLEEYELAVVPVIAVTGIRLPGAPRSVEGVLVVEAAHLPAVIRRIPRGEQPLPWDVVEELSGAAATAFPPATGP